MHIVGTILLVYWALALLNTILNLLLIRRVRPRALDREPLVSIIVPARDEERSIEVTVRALLSQDYGSFELIVVNDRSTDATGAILARIAAEDARLRVVDNEEPPPGWLGKPWALHQGSRHARGELLLFVDADILYGPGALRAVVAEIERSGVTMIGLFPHLEMHGLWENATMANLPMLGFTFLPTWLGDRLKLTTLAIGGGTGNLIRHADYEAIRGHEALKAAVVDDIGLARHVRSSGRHTELIRAENLISVRMYHGLAEMVRGFTKNSFATMDRRYVAVILGLLFSLLVNVFPYVWALTGDRLALATVGLITLTRVILFATLGYPLWSAVFLHPLQILLWTFIMARSMWITGVRRQLNWRGRSYDAAQTRFGAER
ncbi:MAG TPA: glycosyltransferase [Thermoanaerobaculia bacterium]|nr:glycosyltransferase [Thermoanaerobaculia bacterium]